MAESELDFLEGAGRIGAGPVPPSRSAAAVVEVRVGAARITAVPWVTCPGRPLDADFWGGVSRPPAELDTASGPGLGPRVVRG